MTTLESASIAPKDAAERQHIERRWVIILMLAALQVALSHEPTSISSRALLLVHFGFFLLWQPLVSPQRAVKPATFALLALCGGAVMFTDWALILWIAALIGLLGGRGLSADSPRQRTFYLTALLYLLMLLLLWVVPTSLHKVHVPEAIAWLVRLGLPLLLVFMATLPLEKQEQRQLAIDFFYSLLCLQLALLLALGSIAVMQYRGQDKSPDDYFFALLLTLLGVAALLLVLALLWNPFAGYPGLKTYFSRYLLSIGLPLEQWLQQLAEQAEREREAGAFVDAAIPRMAHLPSVVGGEWTCAESEGSFGRNGAQSIDFAHQDLRLKLHTDSNVGPALALHARLLGQVLGEFYVAKRREQMLRQNAYMQAVHETGARLTHDVKNLLQSVMSLSAAGQLMAPDQSQAYAQMVQRQLPQLSKRLQLTLERLQRPSEPMANVMQGAQEWWDNLRERYADRDVLFTLDSVPSAALPRNLFDSVAENLLENAIRKRNNEGNVRIEARLRAEPVACFSVTDSGSSVPQTIARFLFNRPVTGNAGMGIGLLQAARQAEAVGYRLALASNEAGAVTFQLSAGSAESMQALSERSAA